MEKLEELYSQFKIDSDNRLDSFKIESIASLSKISEDAYLEKPTWLGGDEKYVCLFIDLNNSSEISNIKQKSTVAKIYDYFTQNVVDVLSIQEISAEYIDIKGDGVFGLYEGQNAIFKAFVAAITFKTFFQNEISQKFKSAYEITLSCKLSMDFDKILVRKIGRRKFYNEVWAGKLVNNTFKLASLDKQIRKIQGIKEEDNLLIVSETIFTKLKVKEQYAILSCGHSNDGSSSGDKVNLWKEFTDSEPGSQYTSKVFYIPAKWCKLCGDEYLAKILD